MSPFPRRLWWFASAICAVAALAAGLLGFSERHQAFPFGAALVFGALVVFSAHREVALPQGAYLSPAFMVCMAAMVVFQHDGSLLAPLLVGMLNGLLLSGLTKATWGWIPFNAALSGLALLGAALVFGALPPVMRDTVPLALVAALPPALTDFTVRAGLILASYRIELGRLPREVVRELVPMGVQVFPFAMVGLFLGRLYLALGPTVLVLIIVPILIAREMFSSYMQVKQSHDETVQLLIRALEQKDPYTAGHAERVAVYAGYIGEELDFLPARMDRLRFGALMHDIGKLVVPNQLLNKPGKLTEEEFARVRIHEGVSVQMLSHIDFLRPIALHAHSDAMKFDPDNLDHPIEPYIIMVADAYDAMTSTRSYRKALTQEVAFKELRDKSGKQFHPACAEALIRAIEKRNEVHGKGHEEESHFEHAPEVGLGSAGLGDLLPDEKAKQ